MHSSPAHNSAHPAPLRVTHEFVLVLILAAVPMICGQIAPDGPLGPVGAPVEVLARRRHLLLEAEALDRFDRQAVGGERRGEVAAGDALGASHVQRLVGRGEHRVAQRPHGDQRVQRQEHDDRPPERATSGDGGRPARRSGCRHGGRR